MGNMNLQNALVVSAAIFAFIISADSQAVAQNDSAFVKIVNVGAEDGHLNTLFVTDSEELRARIRSGPFATRSATMIVVPNAALTRFVEYVRQQLQQRRFPEGCSADVSNVPMTFQLSIEENYNGGGPSALERDCWRLSPDQSEPFLKDTRAWLSTVPRGSEELESEIAYRLTLVEARIHGER